MAVIGLVDVRGFGDLIVDAPGTGPPLLDALGGRDKAYRAAILLLSRPGLIVLELGTTALTSADVENLADGWIDPAGYGDTSRLSGFSSLRPGVFKATQLAAGERLHDIVISKSFGQTAAQTFQMVAGSTRLLIAVAIDLGVPGGQWLQHVVWDSAGVRFGAVIPT